MGFPLTQAEKRLYNDKVTENLKHKALREHYNGKKENERKEKGADHLWHCSRSLYSDYSGGVFYSSSLS